MHNYIAGDPMGGKAKESESYTKLMNVKISNQRWLKPMFMKTLKCIDKLFEEPSATI